MFPFPPSLQQTPGEWRSINSRLHTPNRKRRNPRLGRRDLGEDVKSIFHDEPKDAGEVAEDDVHVRKAEMEAAVAMGRETAPRKGRSTIRRKDEDNVEILSPERGRVVRETLVGGIPADNAARRIENDNICSGLSARARMALKRENDEGAGAVRAGKRNQKRNEEREKRENEREERERVEREKIRIQREEEHERKRMEREKQRTLKDMRRLNKCANTVEQVTRTIGKKGAGDSGKRMAGGKKETAKQKQFESRQKRPKRSVVASQPESGAKVAMPIHDCVDDSSRNADATEMSGAGEVYGDDVELERDVERSRISVFKELMQTDLGEGDGEHQVHVDDKRYLSEDADGLDQSEDTRDSTPSDGSQDVEEVEEVPVSSSPVKAARSANVVDMAITAPQETQPFARRKKRRPCQDGEEKNAEFGKIPNGMKQKPVARAICEEWEYQKTLGQTSKSLDELESDEDDHKPTWTTVGSSSMRTPQRRARISQPRQAAVKAKRRIHENFEPPNMELVEADLLIDLTLSDSEEEQSTNDAEMKKRTTARALLEYEELRDEWACMSLGDLPRAPCLNPLTEQEQEVVHYLMQKANACEKLVRITCANIVLHGRDFHRLRAMRWLNDEVLNAYSGLVNSRNEAIFTDLMASQRRDIPRTYVFNTYFLTRLSSGQEGYDYPGVRRWTTRAKVDVLEYDLILVPVNLGNHHWVLSGIDLKNREFLYMDSMLGRDGSGVRLALRRWLEDEIRDKYGDELAQMQHIDDWKDLKINWYRIRRNGALPAHLEPGVGKKNRIAMVPNQTDGGSCGVFTVKMADCLALGSKMYFKQDHMPLLRKRMALELFCGRLFV